jgi:DNA-binding GntR family transcriptional regulator
MLGKEAADWLRDAIAGGHFKAGDRLGVKDLADLLGVSTMPVREALLALEQDGFVERLPRRGFRVATVQPQDVSDIFMLHAFVAGVLAERAAQSMDAEGLMLLRQLQAKTVSLARKKLRAEDKAMRIEQLNHEFHRTINRSVQAHRLRWFLRVAGRYVPAVYYRSIPGWIETTLRDHPRIILAIERRDSSAAKKRMEEHVLRGGRLVVEMFDRRVNEITLPNKRSMAGKLTGLGAAQSAV